MNKILLIGNLTRDVTFKELPSTSVATIGIATNKKMGEKKEVCFIDCKAFGRIAEVAKTYLKKGNKVAIDGRLTMESWQDSEGNEKVKFVVIVENLELIDRPAQTDDEIEQAPIKAKSVPKETKRPSDVSIDEDELPF